MVIFELWYVSGKREKVCQYFLSIQISNLLNKSVYIIIPLSANVSQLPKLRQQEAPVLQIRPRTTTTTTTCPRRPDSAACPRQPRRDGRGRDLCLAEPDHQGRAHPPPLLGLHGNSRYSGEGSHGGFIHIHTCKRCLLVFGMKSAILGGGTLQHPLFVESIFSTLSCFKNL